MITDINRITGQQLIDVYRKLDYLPLRGANAGYFLGKKCACPFTCLLIDITSRPDDVWNTNKQYLLKFNDLIPLNLNENYANGFSQAWDHKQILEIDEQSSWTKAEREIVTLGMEDAVTALGDIEKAGFKIIHNWSKDFSRQWPPEE